MKHYKMKVQHPHFPGQSDTIQFPVINDTTPNLEEAYIQSHSQKTYISYSVLHFRKKRNYEIWVTLLFIGDDILIRIEICLRPVGNHLESDWY